MSGRAYASGLVDVDPNQQLASRDHIAVMEPYTNAQCRVGGPFGEPVGELDIDRCCQSSICILEDDKERVPLGVDLAAPVTLNRLSHEALVLSKNLAVPLPELRHEAGGTLDVTEEKGDLYAGTSSM